MSITEFPSAAELKSVSPDSPIQNVVYIGPEAVDRQYLQRPAEVPLKVEIADLEKILDSAVQRLFEIESTSFVGFSPPPMYALKDLFRGSVLPEIDCHEIIAAVDAQDGQEEENPSESDTILDLAYTILGLESVHQEVRLAMKSLAKA